MTLALPHELGGLKMISIKQTIETAKIMWMKRLCNDINAKWKVLAFELMDLTKDQVLKWIPSGYIKKVNGTFYKSLLTIWSDFVRKKPQDLNMKEFVNENLFDNQLFLIGDMPITKKLLGDFDNCRVGDIWNWENNTINNKTHLEEQYNIVLPDMLYNQIYSTTNKVYKQIKKQNAQFESHLNLNTAAKCLSNFSKVKSSDVYKCLIIRQYMPPKSQTVWIESYPFLENLNWAPIYLLPFKITSDTYLITLQFKITHRVFNCKYNLFKWAISETPLCNVCTGIDTLEHYFYYCEESKAFWHQLGNWLTKILSFPFNFTVLEILLGIMNVPPRIWYAVNYVLLYSKDYMQKSKTKNQELSLCIFLSNLKWRLDLDKRIYTMNNRLQSFEDRLGSLLISL